MAGAHVGGIRERKTHAQSNTGKQIFLTVRKYECKDRQRFSLSGGHVIRGVQVDCGTVEEEKDQ